MILYVLLTRLGAVWTGVKTFIGYFSPVLLGCLFAYIMNPLANFYKRRVFRKIRKDGLKRLLSNVLAVVTVLLFVALILLVILPQFIDSIGTFANNLEGYISTVEEAMEKWGISERLGTIGINVEQTTKRIIDTVVDYVKKNLVSIISKTANTGKSLLQLVISFILSLYLLAEKEMLKTGGKRLMRALIKPDGYASAMSFLRRSNDILNRYIVFNLVDALIVGMVNAVFMAVTGMPYLGLVSFVVAITNLIPTFGPVIGGAVGAFVLVLVRPWHALAFLIFTMVLQTCDGYVIKPRLFGNSLGVSGLWILIGVIVGGRMFGLVGILCAIPGVAILDFAYTERFLPWLERRASRERETGETGA